MRRGTRKILAPLIVIGLSCLFSIALVEGLVTLILGPQMRVPRHVMTAPWGVRMNEPHARYTHRWKGGWARFEINGQGMRSPRETSYEKPAGTKRILLIGDSYTIGYESKYEDLWSTHLENVLKERGYTVEVLNTGVSGTGTAEQLQYLEREGIKFAPDVVVQTFFVNDLNDNVRADLLRLDVNGELVRRREEYVPGGAVGDFLNTNRILSFLGSNSNAFSLFKETVISRVKMAFVDWRQDNAVNEQVEAAEKEEAKSDAPEATKSRGALAAAIIGDDEDDFEYRRRLLGALTQRMLDFCRERGVPFVLQTVPLQEEGPRGPLDDVFPYTAFKRDQPGLILVPLVDVLAPAVATKAPLYWWFEDDDHHHFTPAAHELVGRYLAEVIIDRNLLADAPPVPPSED